MVQLWPGAQGVALVQVFAGLGAGAPGPDAVVRFACAVDQLVAVVGRLVGSLADSASRFLPVFAESQAATGRRVVALAPVFAVQAVLSRPRAFVVGRRSGLPAPADQAFAAGVARQIPEHSEPLQAQRQLPVSHPASAGAATFSVLVVPTFEAPASPVAPWRDRYFASRAQLEWSLSLALPAALLPRLPAILLEEQQPESGCQRRPSCSLRSLASGVDNPADIAGLGYW